MKIKSSIIRDKLEITDATGEVVKEIPFVINTTRIADEVTRKRIALSKIDKTNSEALGRAVVDLIYTLFGEDTANEIFTYYDGDHIAMMADLSPVISEVIYPVFDSLRRKMVDTIKKTKRV